MASTDRADLGYLHQKLECEIDVLLICISIRAPRPGSRSDHTVNLGFGCLTWRSSPIVDARKERCGEAQNPADLRSIEAHNAKDFASISDIILKKCESVSTLCTSTVEK